MSVEIKLTGRESISLDGENLRVYDYDLDFEIQITPEFMDALKLHINEQQSKLMKFKL